MATTTSRPAEPATADGTTAQPTLGAMVLAAAQRHTGTALRRRDASGWHDISYAELGRIAREIARGLMVLGVQPGDRVAILSSTRAEWTLVDCGAHCAGATVVPIYHTNSPEECHYVLEHSGSQVVLCEDAEQLAKVERIRDRLPELRHVVTFDDSGVLPLDLLRARGAEIEPAAVDRAVAAVRPDDVATIVYTSGTTGPPKGCLTTHRNCMATVAMYEQVVDFDFSRPIVIFMFLPLAHSLARVTQLVTLDIGATLAFWRGDPTLVIEDLADVRPTHFPSVPRVLEKIHTKALGRVDDAGRLKRAMFDWAVATGGRARRAERAGKPLNPVRRRELQLADRLVLSHIRALFGDRLQLALTGAAPIGRDVLEFFDACGVPVLEGYGLTETTAAATLNPPKGFRLGTVGPPLPGAEVTIAPDGEILTRGPHVFAGYHRNDQATREALDEHGWFRSGDLGAMDADGYVRVTGRKKDIIITSSGKNITPSNLESLLREIRWISQAVVYGDNRPYIVGMFTLDPDELPALAERCDAEPDMAQMATDPRVIALIDDEVAAVNQRVARIEQVKRFAILPHDLSQPRGELTPTMKIKRNVIYERYRDVIDQLYEAG